MVGWSDSYSRYSLPQSPGEILNMVAFARNASFTSIITCVCGHLGVLFLKGFSHALSLCTCSCLALFVDVGQIETDVANV